MLLSIWPLLLNNLFDTSIEVEFHPTGTGTIPRVAAGGKSQQGTAPHMSLARYFVRKEEDSFYREKTFTGTDEEYLEAKRTSSTIFVSNIPTTVKEERIWELFMLCGPVRRVIMGVNRNTLRFCGFCFVEFYSADSASAAVRTLNEFRLDQSLLSMDKDYGFVEGRQYGRGIFGGRVKSDKLYLEDRYQRREMHGKRGRYGEPFEGGRHRRRDDRLRYPQHPGGERYEDMDAKKRKM